MLRVNQFVPSHVYQSIVNTNWHNRCKGVFAVLLITVLLMGVKYSSSRRPPPPSVSINTGVCSKCGLSTLPEDSHVDVCLPCFGCIPIQPCVRCSGWSVRKWDLLIKRYRDRGRYNIMKWYYNMVKFLWKFSQMAPHSLPSKTWNLCIWAQPQHMQMSKRKSPETSIDSNAMMNC